MGEIKSRVHIPWRVDDGIVVWMKRTLIDVADRLPIEMYERKK